MNKKGKIAVLTPAYPTENKPNTLGFVHSRVRAYQRSGLDVEVYTLSQETKEYLFENVIVHCGNKEHIKKEFDKKQYDIILVHFLDKTLIDIVGDHKCIIWVHGFEALSWKRRLYNLNPRIPLYIIENTLQLKNFKKYAISHPESKFIFVSEWMKRITCTDIGYNIDNYEIVHNYIDETIFKYEKKQPEDRKKLLLIRSFANKKYANDITVKFIQSLSKKDYFNDLSITIYGDGKFFDSLTDKIKTFSNVRIHKGFITQVEIAELQRDYGVFLCPTRQDAQGVSMCEAMCSGLVPLTSMNTAIPEFVNADSEGLLCNNNDINSFVEAYESLLFDENRFLQISEAASKRVRKQCSYKNTIEKEIEIIGGLIDKK